MNQEKSPTDFNGAPLVGVASTFYTDKQDTRFELALENAERWHDNNLPYVIIDGSPMLDSSDTWVADAHKARGVTVVRSDINGIATQRLQGVKFAFDHGADKVVGHEPEKILMSDFSSEIIRGLDEHAVLIIGRTAIAEASLPSVQRRTEHMAGWILEQTHHLPFDTLSGGRGFNREGAKELAKYPANQPGFNNWIYLYHTPLAARQSGLSIGGIEVDLIHPATMTAEEEGDPKFDRKRYDQFKLQLDYLLSRQDVDSSVRPIADAVLAAMSGLDTGTTNDMFSDQLKRLEARLQRYGYNPERH
jgi:hypothetical protein